MRPTSTGTSSATIVRINPFTMQFSTGAVFRHVQKYAENFWMYLFLFMLLYTAGGSTGKIVFLTKCLAFRTRPLVIDQLRPFTRKGRTPAVGGLDIA